MRTRDDKKNSNCIIIIWLRPLPRAQTDDRRKKQTRQPADTTHNDAVLMRLYGATAATRADKSFARESIYYYALLCRYVIIRIGNNNVSVGRQKVGDDRVTPRTGTTSHCEDFPQTNKQTKTTSRRSITQVRVCCCTCRGASAWW